jgi:small ligand-binding sensory domain FIST
MQSVFQGFSDHPETATAVQQATDGWDGESGWALVFAGGRHDGEEVISQLRERCGGIPVYGGSTVGTISASQSGYSHFELLVTIFPPEVTPVTSITASLASGEAVAGRLIGEHCDPFVEEGSCVMAFYDSIKRVPPPELYVGASVLSGIYEVIGNRSFSLSGGGLVGDLQMANSYVFTGTAAERHCVQALVLPPTISAHTTVMHGCTPISMPMEITRLEGNLIFELDGRPALDVVNEITHTGTSPEDLKKICLGISIGKNYGDRWADYDEANYVNRLLIAADPETKALVIFDDDFEVGTWVEIMARDNIAMVDSTKKGAERAVAYGQDKHVLFSMYVDCAGRTTAWCGHSEEEADVLRSNFGSRAPLAGCYCGVEFTPVMGRSRAVDWNGVLTQFVVNKQ